MELCPALGITIPVGKDSMSMKTMWEEEESGEQKSVTAPLSLVVSGFAPVIDVANTLTRRAQLHTDCANGVVQVFVLARVPGRGHPVG